MSKKRIKPLYHTKGFKEIIFLLIGIGIGYIFGIEEGARFCSTVAFNLMDRLGLNETIQALVSFHTGI